VPVAETAGMPVNDYLNTDVQAVCSSFIYALAPADH
jgi:3-oxoacyl-[acyl-carrier-protein] synthase III